MTWVVRAIRSSEGVARLRSVTFSSSSMHDRDEIWVAKGRRRAGDGPDRRQPRQPRASHQKPHSVPAPHGKAHSSPAASRKSAFCNQSLTEKCTLQLAPHGKAHSAQPPHGKPQFGRSEARGMRLSVRTRSQNALSRDVPRPECAFPHLRKRRATSRKSALWPSRLTKNRTLRPPCPPQHGTAPLSPHSSPREWCSKRPFS